MSLASLAAKFAQDEAAATGILFGAALPALLGASAIAIDLGSLYLAERQLQGIADAAALAATQGDIEQDGKARAQAIIDQTGVSGISLRELTPGEYRQDKNIAYSDRFDPTSAEPSAVSVELQREVPLFFGKVLNFSDQSMVRAKAISARKDLAAFSIGSRLLELSGGLGNQVLSQLAGTELGLTVMDVDSLASTEVDLLGYADALKARTDRGGDKTYAEVFGSEVAVQDAVDALADSATDGVARDLLRGIAGQLGSETILVSDMIDLGIMGDTDFTDGNSELKVDAFSLLRAFLEASRGDSYTIDLDLSASGLGKVRVKLVGGSGMRSSPWLTVSSATDYVIRTSQARLYVEFRISNGGVAGLGSVRIPIYVELAEAEARLSDIQCTGDEHTDGVTLSVTPSVGTLAIAAVDAEAMNDLSIPVNLQPAQILKLPLASVYGFSEIDLGGAHAQPVHFGPEAIARHETKTVSTDDLVRAVASSLATNLELEVEAVGLSVSGSILSGKVADLIGSVAPDLDIAINGLTQLLGVRVGSADVRIDRYICGVPQIVA
jgi:uncharacterized membrane protein